MKDGILEGSLQQIVVFLQRRLESIVQDQRFQGIVNVVRFSKTEATLRFVDDAVVNLKDK
jgi:hypothetical protein